MTSRTFHGGLACLAFLLATSATAVAQEFTDLSESGQALRFEPVPDEAGVVRVEVVEPRDVLRFEVEEAVAGRPLTLRIGPVPDRFAPAQRVGGGPWQPLPSEPLGADRVQIEWTDMVPRFQVRLRSPRDPSFAQAPYYDLARFQSYIAQIQTEPLARVTQIGNSIEGRPLYRIVIDTPRAPNQPPKQAFLMVVRQHGDEFGSSYVLEGLLDLLLSRNGLTAPPELLSHVRWVIYPLMNPDGAVLNQRGNVNGVDLNRDWDATGCNASQQLETFVHQCDIEDQMAIHPFARGGDHHGWTFGNHGGYRYANGLPPSSVTPPEYRDARKDTAVITRNDPTQDAWQENGGTAGMLRVEMFQRHGFLLHTPEYDSFLATEAAFHQKGQAYARAVQEFLFAPTFTDAAGIPVSAANLPADEIYVVVDDFDEDESDTADQVQVEVRDTATGDRETLILVERSNRSPYFQNITGLPLVVSDGTVVSGDGVLESLPGSTLEAVYVDDDYPPHNATARIPVRPDNGRPAR